jgi:pimeloyl-ACP methyl ester carboxylesterase
MTIRTNLYRIPREIDSQKGSSDQTRSKEEGRVSKLPSRLLRFLGLAVFVMGVLPAHAQVAVQTSDFYVTTTDSAAVKIYVHHKFGPGPSRVPVLLIHGTWVNSGTWDFPGRSVMDYLAVRGYDVYALDLRGMGLFQVNPPPYSQIDIFTRVNDAVAVAGYIVATTHQIPVVMGWSQGGAVTGLLAELRPDLVAGVGLLSVPRDGFLVPPDRDLLQDLNNILVNHLDHFIPTPNEVNEVAFGTDPITGKPTISPDALATFVSPQFLQPDSTNAILEEAAFSGFFVTYLGPAWKAITVPALVVDGALDPLVGEGNATALFEALGSKNKQLIIFPRNSHGWFLEDNHDATDRVFDRFLSQFGY